MHRKLAVSLVFFLLALTIRATLNLHARVLGGRKRREGLADLVRKADARRGSPGAVIRSRWRVCSSSRSDGSARQRLPPAGGRCCFGRHEVPFRIIGLSAGASTLPARDGCADWAAGSFGIPGPPKSSRVLGPIARVRQASPVSPRGLPRPMSGPSVANRPPLRGSSSRLRRGGAAGGVVRCGTALRGRAAVPSGIDVRTAAAVGVARSDCRRVTVESPASLAGRSRLAGS